MFIFDYLTFLDYYSNHKNLQKDFIGIGPLYYFVNKNKPAKIVRGLYFSRWNQNICKNTSK